MLPAPSSSSVSVTSLASSTRAIPYGVAHIGNDTFLVIWSGKDVDTVSLCTSSFPPDARTISVPLNRKVHFDFGLPAHESTSPQRDTNRVKSDCLTNETQHSDLLSSPSSLAVLNVSPHGRCYHRLYPSPDGRLVAVIAHALDGTPLPASPPPVASSPHDDVLRSACTHYMLLLTEVPFRVVEWQTPPYRIVRSVSWFVQKRGKTVEKKKALADSSVSSVTGIAASEANTVSMTALHSSSPPPPLVSPTRRLLLLLHTGELLSYDVSRHSLSVTFPPPSVVDLWKRIFRSFLSTAASSSSPPPHTRHSSGDKQPLCRSAPCGGRATSPPPPPPPRRGGPLPHPGGNTKETEVDGGERVRVPTPQGQHEWPSSSSHPRGGSRGAAKRPSASSPSRLGSSPSSSHLSPPPPFTTTTAPMAPHTLSRGRTASGGVGKGVLKKMNRFGVIVPDANGQEKEAKKRGHPRVPPPPSPPSSSDAAASSSRSLAPRKRATAASAAAASPVATTTKTVSGSGHREAVVEKKTKTTSPLSTGDGGCRPQQEGEGVKKNSPTPAHFLEAEGVVPQKDAKKEEEEEEANALLTRWFGDRLHLVVDMYMMPPTHSLPPVLLFLTRDGDVFAANVDKETGLPASSSCSGADEAATRVHHLIHGTLARQATHKNESAEAAREAERGMALAVRSILLDEDTGLHAILLAYADGRLTATLVDEPSLLARDRVVLVDNGSENAPNRRIDRWASEEEEKEKKRGGSGGHEARPPSPTATTDAPSRPHFSPPLPSFLHRGTQQLVPLEPQWHIHLGREPSTTTSSSWWGNRIVQMEVVHHVCLMRFEDGAAYLVCLPRWNVSRGGWTYWYPFLGRGGSALALGGMSFVVEGEGKPTGSKNAAGLTPPPRREEEEDDGNHTLSSHPSSTALVALEEEYQKWSLVHSDASIVPDPIACRIPLEVSGFALGMGVRELLLSPLEISHGVLPPKPPAANPIVSVRLFSVEVAKLLRGAICASSAEWEWAWKAASPAEAEAAKAAVSSSRELACTKANTMEAKERIDDSLRQALQLLSKSYRCIFGGDSQKVVKATMTEEMRCLEKCVELQEREEKAVAEREKKLWERVQILQKDTSYASHTIDSWERTVLDATVHQRGSSVFSVANDRLGNVHDALNQMENLLHGVSTS